MSSGVTSTWQAKNAAALRKMTFYTIISTVYMEQTQFTHNCTLLRRFDMIDGFFYRLFSTVGSCHKPSALFLIDSILNQSHRIQTHLAWSRIGWSTFSALFPKWRNWKHTTNACATSLGERLYTWFIRFTINEVFNLCARQVDDIWLLTLFTHISWGHRNYMHWFTKNVVRYVVRANENQNLWQKLTDWQAHSGKWSTAHAPMRLSWCKYVTSQALCQDLSLLRVLDINRNSDHTLNSHVQSTNYRQWNAQHQIDR